MADLIERQAAIDALTHKWDGMVTSVFDVINSLPSVQSDHSGDVNGKVDLIDRQAVIDLLKQMRKDGDMVPWEGMDVFARIRKLPSAQPEPQWIPCSERLPEDNVPVNITWINRKPELYYAEIKDVPFTATGVYFKGKWYWYSSTVEDYLAEYGAAEWDEIEEAMHNSIEVVAWMPLPEPWNGAKMNVSCDEKSQTETAEWLMDGISYRGETMCDMISRQAAIDADDDMVEPQESEG